MEIREAFREHKFRLPAEVADAVMDDIVGFLPRGEGRERAAYPIVSEYYDTEERDAYWERDRKVGNRRKLRVRLVGRPGDAEPPAAFLEVKHKRDGVGVQRCLPVPVEAVTAPGLDVRELLAGMQSGMTDKLDRLLAQEIMLLLPKVQPVVQMRFDRIAFEDEEGVRVTFDSDVRCRSERLDLQPDDDRFAHAILPPGERIMEVKIPEVAPYWMRDLLPKHGLIKVAISKYCDAVECCDPVVAPLVARMKQPAG